MKAICDTSSLIKIRKGNVIDSLGLLFDAVLLPSAVKEECTDPETSAMLTKDFLEVHVVKNLLAIGGIGSGEREAISLAVELNVPTIITDDEKAVKKAIQAGCKPIRTPQVLLLAKQGGHLPSVKAALDAMRAEGEGIEDEVYNMTLSQAGEL